MHPGLMATSTRPTGPDSLLGWKSSSKARAVPTCNGQARRSIWFKREGAIRQLRQVHIRRVRTAPDPSVPVGRRQELPDRSHCPHRSHRQPGQPVLGARRRTEPAQQAPDVEWRCAHRGGQSLVADHSIQIRRRILRNAPHLHLGRNIVTTATRLSTRPATTLLPGESIPADLGSRDTYTGAER